MKSHYYYSNLDMQQRFPLLNLGFKDCFESVEVIIDPLALKDSNVEVEFFNYIFFLFSKRPQVSSSKKSSDLLLRLFISGNKSISEVVEFIVKRCSDTRYNCKFIRKSKKDVFFIFNFKFTKQNELSHLPSILLKESDFTFPSVTFKIRIRKNYIPYKSYLYPIWLFRKQKGLKAQKR